MKQVLFYGINIDDNMHDDAVTVVTVKLDDKYYEFVEDPDDGYRSYCSVQVRYLPLNGETFSLEHTPVPTYMEVIEEGHEYFKGMKLFRDAEGTQQVFKLGTDYYDDYYPMCVMNYDIELINEIYAEAILLGDE